MNSRGRSAFTRKATVWGRQDASSRVAATPNGAPSVSPITQLWIRGCEKPWACAQARYAHGYSCCAA